MITLKCVRLFTCVYIVFHKKTVPFVILLYLYFYKAEFHENPPEYTRGIGHYEHKINFRDSLTILCHCHYNERTAKCQVNEHKTKFILMQHQFTSTAKINIYCQNYSTLVFYDVQDVCRLQKNTSTETLTPLLDSVVDDVPVHVLSLLRDALPQLIQSMDILSVDAFLEHSIYTIVYWI